jgi:hypothetical protein
MILPADTEILCEKVFASLASSLSQLVENIEWLTGVRDELYVPEILKPQLSRLKELEILGGFYNLHAHLESVVLTMMTYHYPEITSQHASKKSSTLKKNLLERYPHPREIQEFAPQRYVVPNKKPEGIYLEMDPEFAEQYGF